MTSSSLFAKRWSRKDYKIKVTFKAYKYKAYNAYKIKTKQVAFLSLTATGIQFEHGLNDENFPCR
jgi:hypothetical protein